VAFTLHVPRPLRAALALAVLLALAGTTYQGVMTSLERRRFRHPGRLVDVGGHQLHIHCTGAGSPVVVLEAPAAGLSVHWTRVQEALTPLTRICSYDRAGLGWSERGDGPFDPARVPVELRALLEGAREAPPYVIVGQGLGTAFARAFGARFPEMTRGVVLLDPPDAEGGSDDRRRLGRMPDAMPWLARIGLLRLAAGPSAPDDAPSTHAFMNRPDHLTRAAGELARWDDAVRPPTGATTAGAPVPTTSLSLPGPIASDRGAEAAADAIRQAVVRARQAR
jgi:pimeloyl-ACP methyl ester carboxylesterase